MEIGLVRKVNIDEEMQQSYLDYAMSVIVARALPDARDGLKPVQRRILYAMYDMGLNPQSSYKKSARIVGEVLGKYHPHGDMAVYEAMARLAQNFTMRYQLVDGQGNFGSVDGDPPAAMRYTEAKLANIALELLNQLDRNTVDLTRNFDESMAEPIVLPAAIPNLLVNGASGIAVGMATTIPPHNLSETVDALIYMLQKWEKIDDLSVGDLMKFIKGPDFPTGGIILEEIEKDSLLTAYATGKGRVVLRGRVDVEEMSRGRNRLIITELPYMVNKSSLIERVAELVRNNIIEGLSDLRDESDRQGMRIVIELKQGADFQEILRTLYQKTPLQTTIGINLLALVNDEPRLLTLKQALKVYLEHRMVVVRRRSEFDLEKAKQRSHVLEGLRIAIQCLDEIIKLIRGSADAEVAKDRLIKKYKLSSIQAQAILDMPLKRLAALERKKIEDEYKGLEQIIKELTVLLKSSRKIRQVIEEELTQIRIRYGDRRRTQIVSLKAGEVITDKLTTTEMIVAQKVWVAAFSNGTIFRTDSEEMPKIGMRQGLTQLFLTNTSHTLYLVAESGKACATSVHTLPEGSQVGDAVPISKLFPFSADEKIVDVVSLPPKNEEMNEQFVITMSSLGLVKKSSILDLPGPAANLFTLVKVNPGDKLWDVFFSNGEKDIFVLTQHGNGIRFKEDDVRPMNLAAAGVNAIKLPEQDVVIGSGSVDPDDEALLVTDDGNGWRLAMKEFPIQGRYGRGVGACKLAEGELLAGVLIGSVQAAGMVLFESAPSVFINLDNLKVGKRTNVGKELVTVRKGDRVIHVVPIKAEGVRIGHHTKKTRRKTSKKNR
jgi:DNA gyrase subunit A